MSVQDIDYQAKVDVILMMEKRWRQRAVALYALPVLLIVFGATYSSWRVIGVEASLKAKRAEAARLKSAIEVYQGDLEELQTKNDAYNTLKDQLPPDAKASFAAIESTEGPINKSELPAYVIVASMSTMERARAFARGFMARHPNEKLAVFKSNSGHFAVTLGPASDPKEAKNRLDRARNTLGVKDAYIRYSADWVEQRL